MQNTDWKQYINHCFLVCVWRISLSYEQHDTYSYLQMLQRSVSYWGGSWASLPTNQCQRDVSRAIPLSHHEWRAFQVPKGSHIDLDPHFHRKYRGNRMIEGVNQWLNEGSRKGKRKGVNQWLNEGSREREKLVTTEGISERRKQKINNRKIARMKGRNELSKEGKDLLQSWQVH